jgi:hypothetical protein
LSAFQQQSLVLALVCFAATLFFYVVARSRPNTWLSHAITGNLVALAIIFGTFAIIEVDGNRSEIAASLISELPFGVVVTCLCVAQAGYLPFRIGGPPLAVVAGRPRVRLLLASAGLALPAVWMMAAIFGFLWPSPALQTLSPAPLEFVIFKCLLMAPAAFYAGFAAVLFLSTARSASLVARLRLKNAAFALAAWCLAMVALESAAFAGVRAWLPDERRVPVLNALMVTETVLAIACVSAFILGIALRYTPDVRLPLARHAATRWLPEQDRFDAHRWRTVVGGVTRGVVRATHRINAAADRLDLSPIETKHAIGTIHHIAAIRGGFRDPDAVTPDRARVLHGLQSEVMRDTGLVRKISEIGAHAATPGTTPEDAGALHVELDAALYLIDHAADVREPADERPLWFYLAAVSASDVDLVDPSQVRSVFGGRTGYDEAFEAYTGAVSSWKGGSRD